MAEGAFGGVVERLAPPPTSPRWCPHSPARPADQRPDDLRQWRPRLTRCRISRRVFARLTSCPSLAEGAAMPKTIVITGASIGFGASSARHLADAGHTVYAGTRGTTGKNTQAVADASACATEHHVELRPIEMDVSDQVSVDAAIATILAEAGGIDVVVHNAGHVVLATACWCGSARPAPAAAPRPTGDPTSRPRPPWIPLPSATPPRWPASASTPSSSSPAPSPRARTTSLTPGTPRTTTPPRTTRPGCQTS
jgi:hypothetical protein